MKQDGGVEDENENLEKIGLAGWALLAGSGAGWPSGTACHLRTSGPPADSPYVTCTVTMEFVRPVDLDGDGVADFTHERFRSACF
jgi:hypothetical protein